MVSIDILNLTSFSKVRMLKNVSELNKCIMTVFFLLFFCLFVLFLAGLSIILTQHLHDSKLVPFVGTV